MNRVLVREFFSRNERTKKVFLLFTTLFMNTVAACLEGASFSLIMVGFAALSQESHALGMLSKIMLPLVKGKEGMTIFIWCILGAVVAQILRSLLVYLGQLSNAFLATKIQLVIQRKIYAKIFSLSYPAVMRYKSGDLVNYAAAPPTYLPMLFDVFNRFVVTGFTIAAYVIFMVLISCPLTLTLLTLFTIGALSQRALLKKTGKASEALSEQVVELSKQTSQTIDGLKVVHLFHRKQQILEGVERGLHQIGKRTLRLKKLYHLVGPINEIMAVFLVGCAILLGFYFLKDSTLPLIPTLLTFLALTYRLGVRLYTWMGCLGEANYYKGSLKRTEEILNVPIREKDPPKTGPLQFQSAITFKNVEIVYPGKSKPAVHDLSFTIPKGKVVAFVGASGAGKSTVIDLLLRLYEPDQGKILIDGVEVSSYPLREWMRLFGTVSQEPFLFAESILDNIRFGKLGATREEVEEAAKGAGAHEFISHLPNGYETVVGERGYRLSGGEKQRISLARALVSDPEVLVLDEATSHLDSHSEHLIQQALSQLQGRKTLVVVAHRLSTIQRADCIMVMEKGRLIEQGTHEELLRQGGKYHHLWSLQTSQTRYGQI